MVLDLELLKEMASQIRRRTLRLAGTSEGAEPLGVGAGGDRTRLIDAESEDAVFSTLKKWGISCTVVSEEKGFVAPERGPGEGYLIVDALDGTNNALRGIPFYAVSLAAADRPRLSAVHTSLVQDLYHGETYWAVRGKGSYLDGKPLKASEVSTLQKALVGINFNPPIPRLQMRKISSLARRAKHSRHFGANALEVCYVASGRLDAFVDVRGRLRVTDLAAAYHILREAGGLIVDEQGRILDASADTPTQRVSFIAAGNPLLLAEIQKALRAPL
ncbi:inositol monophosphatase family protein [Candidatus Hecatella orcuttiae]|jgi:myo-inositol-1(or 4)-monophosphatase|uniref:inositol monophosphatase family protein n=1 Tax=Candidatus Hecatella orcuttiae TaxID=1935119 RepID=UPI002867B08E|nr:inositol monophosphatase family protein [Candidatus Hecatella orcuttiae]